MLYQKERDIGQVRGVAHGPQSEQRGAAMTSREVRRYVVFSKNIIQGDTPENANKGERQMSEGWHIAPHIKSLWEPMTLFLTG